MWEVKIVCSECKRAHSIHSEFENKPRSFVFVCPVTGEQVSSRFVDPSVITSPWTEVSATRPDSILVHAAESGGSIDV